MSKYQALIDALAGVNGQLGQPSLHSGHVIYAETEEWCGVDINVKLSANKHISGPLARFIKEAANPATIRALLADLDAMRVALKSVQAAIYMDDAGQLRLTRSFDELTIDAALSEASRIPAPPAQRGEG